MFKKGSPDAVQLNRKREELKAGKEKDITEQSQGGSKI